MVEQEKIDHSINVLKLAAKMSNQYYHKPLLLAYSGGKDSDVMIQLALESGINFEVKNSHTTVDAPETVYHIRKKFAELEAKGIKCEVIHARYKDGSLITMWNLIPKKLMPPTQMVRYCCQYLKETTTPNRFIAVGVREDESLKRRGRGDFQTKHGTTKVHITKSLEETVQVYEDAQKYDEVFDCKYIELAKKNKDLICNPIYYWTESDVWDFLKDRGVEVNPLYLKGFKRVGCVGCPMASRREREREFRMYPQYKLNFIKAFDKLGESGRFGSGQTGQEIFDWWMKDPRFYGQTEFEGWRDD